MFNQYLEIGGRLKPTALLTLISMSLRSKFKHSKVFILWFLNTNEVVKKTRLRLVFSTCLSVFRNQRKNTYSCLNYYLKRSFQIRAFSSKQLFHFTVHFPLQHKVLPSGASTGHIAMGNDNHLSTSRLSKQNTTKILEISHSKIMKNRPMLPLWRQTTAMASRFYFRVLQARTSRPLREEDSREHLGCLRIIFTGGGTTMMEQNIIWITIVVAVR